MLEKSGGRVTARGPREPVARLWRNQKRYCGDNINIQEVLEACAESARASGWRQEIIEKTPQGELPAFVRTGSGDGVRLRVYISAGIHGDEPAGPLAAERLLRENRWPSNFDLWLCPCLNPAGFDLNTRENASGVDLNRDYLSLHAREVEAHVRWLNRQPGFDLSLCLHEDWEAGGFYVYELNPDSRPSLAERIVTGAETVCPVDESPLIEGWTANGGVIRPGIEPSARKDWPEAFYLITHKTRMSYTLEAPSDFPLQVRIEALVEGVNGACAALRG